MRCRPAAPTGGPEETAVCPVCREPMVAYQLEGVEIDRCVRCDGTWLDAGELEMITELAGIAPGELARALVAAGDRGRSRRRCPRCPRRLREIGVGTEPRLDLDRCPWGHGLWFDEGEMERLIESFDHGEPGVVARFFGNLYRDEVAANEGGD